MKHLLLALAIVGGSAFALESGERVVINDQTFVVIHADDWANITNRVKMLEDIATDRWNKQHSTDEGRKAWHGAVKHTTITNGEVIVEYKDGYKHVEAVASSRPAGRARSITQATAEDKERQDKRDAFIRERAARIQARRAIERGEKKEVTVTIER